MFGSQEKILEPKVKNFHGRLIHAVLQSLTPFSDLVDLADMTPFGAEKHIFGGLVKRGNQIWIVFG